MRSRLDTNKIVGKNIKKYRRLNGFTRIELAEIIDCSINKASRIENGRAELNLGQVLFIAETLNINVDKLIMGIGFQYNQDENINRLYYVAESLL